MKTLSIKTFLLIILCFSMLACNDFLEQVPASARSVDNAYKTAADFNNAAIGVYATFKNAGLYTNGGQNSALLMMSDGASDAWDIGQTRNGLTTFQYEIEDFNISISNTLVTNAWVDHYIGIGRANSILDKIVSASVVENLKNRYEGEARFLRAYFYFNLVRLFGDVPLVLNTVSNPYAANDLTRTPAATVYETIISDLKIAEQFLPETIVAADAGRASRWAAKALLGKVYLTQKNYPLASEKLAEVIASGRFNVTANNYPAVFSFATSFDANKDVILAVQYRSGQVGQGGSLWSSSVPFGANGSLFNTTAAGEGYFRPTADLVNAYEPGDLRKIASVATSYQNGAVTITERYCVKYRQNGPIFGDSDTDFPILRYADVLLMQAEALNEQGQTGSAEPFLNQVRTRAGLAAKTVLSQADFRLAVEQERYVELAFEGHRWFDLVRTDRYLTVMNAKGYKTQAFHRLYPVPQRETDLNKALGQNTGY